MSDSYRLVFRGEVFEGQHPAVVRRRLGEQLRIDSARLDRLFSGQPVVVKAEADAAGAARLQALFRKAGARLRVVSMEPGPEAAAPRTDGRHEPSPSAGRLPVPVGNAVSGAPVAAAVPGDPAAGSFDPDVLPVGSDVLREDEREAWQPRQIDTSHLVLQDPARLRDEPVLPVPAPPDTSHLGLLDP